MAAALMANAPPDFMKVLPQDELPVINRKATFYGTTISIQILAWLAVGFRMYCRAKLAHGFGVDDLFVAIAICSATAGTVTLNMELQYGLGQHLGTTLIPGDEISNNLKFYFATNVTYMCSTALIKLAILLQYLRLYHQPSQLLPRRVCQGTIAVISVWGLSFLFTAMFSCSPVSDVWRFTADRNCFGMGSSDPDEFFHAHLAQATSNMIFDYVVLLIPLFFYRYLELGQKNRLSLAGLFTIGTCVATSGAVRFAFIIKSRAATHPFYDLTWLGPPILISSALEVQTAVVCASVPIFWPTLAATLHLDRILVVREVAVHSEPRRPSFSQAWKRTSESSETELRQLTREDSCKGREQRVYGKDTYVTGWEALHEEESSDRKGNHVEAKRASSMNHLERVQNTTWLDMN